MDSSFYFDYRRYLGISETLGGILNSRNLRTDDSRGHIKPQKKAKGCVSVLKTGIDPGHPQEEGRPAGPAIIS